MLRPGRVLIAKGFAEGAQAGAPQDARCSAGFVGPCVAGGRQCVAGSGTFRVGVSGGGHRRVDAADHPAPVVAVARDSVHVAEPCFGAVQGIPGGSERLDAAGRVAA